jgi:hypothetical protein
MPLKLNMEQENAFSPFAIRKAFSPQSEPLATESPIEIRFRAAA